MIGREVKLYWANFPHLMSHCSETLGIFVKRRFGVYHLVMIPSKLHALCLTGF